MCQLDSIPGRRFLYMQGIAYDTGQDLMQELLATVSTPEFIHLPSSIDNFLFACVKRMTVCTDVDMHTVTTVRGPRLKAVSAAASHAN